MCRVKAQLGLSRVGNVDPGGTEAGLAAPEDSGGRK